MVGETNITHAGQCGQNNNSKKKANRGFPGGSAVKSPPANAGDAGSIPGLGRCLLRINSEAHESEILQAGSPRACDLGYGKEDTAQP